MPLAVPTWAHMCTLSKTTSQLSCFFLDVFDEPGDVQPVGQRVMKIDVDPHRIKAG